MTFKNNEHEKRAQQAEAEYERREHAAKIRFAARLKAYMETSGLKQKDIAEAIGRTPQAISGIIRAPETCSVQLIRVISNSVEGLSNEYAIFRHHTEGDIPEVDENADILAELRKLTKRVAALTKEVESKKPPSS